MIKERDYLWDNIKAFLIFTVVTGHLCSIFASDSHIANRLYYFIYTFHMPAFLFVSGYWAKNYSKKGVVRGEKATLLFAYYLVFQIIFLIFSPLIGAKLSLSIFTPKRGMWYLFAMFVYYLMIPVVEKLKPWVVLPICALLGLYIGIENNAGTFFTVQRIFNFSVFFFAGYYTQSAAIEKLRGLKLRHLYGALAVVLSILMWNFTRYTGSFFEVPLKILYGKASYESMKLSTLHGMFLRAEGWIMASLVILGLILLFPAKKAFYSYVGTNSIQAYIFHFFIVVPGLETHVFDFAIVHSEIGGIIVIIACAIITFILAFPIFSYPFKWIQSGVKILYEKCNRY